MKPQLLCTFTDNNNLFSCIKTIRTAYNDDKIGIDIYNTPTNMVCIYNVVDKTKRLPDTISINKKKETNTYYSINALNALIMALNNGVLDKTFAINWQDYVNSMLLSAGPGKYRCMKIEKINTL